MKCFHDSSHTERNLMSSDKERLREQEKRISAAFLKHSPKESSFDEEEGMLNIFLETVGGVHEIVTSRLYRCEATSLESYFNSRWGISRAQVYRYMDCYFVLNQLHGISELPGRERLCRSLKKCAKTERDMRRLWESTLILAGDERPIPTQLIHDAWTELKKLNKIESRIGHKRSYSETSLHTPKRTRTTSQSSDFQKRSRTSSRSSDRKTLEGHISIDDLVNQYEEEYVLEEGSTLEPASYEANEYREYLVETSKDETVDELVKSLFSTMDALSDMGYKLQPKVGHAWYPTPIKQWRMIPTDFDLEMEVPSLIRSSSEILQDYE